jgi:hypothetical protein
MRKMMIVGGAFLVALVPAGLGLAANPSLSARVPIPPAQVRSVSEASTTAPARPAAVPSAESTEHESTEHATPDPDRSDDDGDDHRGGGSGRGRHSGRDG